VHLPDKWSFRQKPTGGFKHLLRVPVHLYRWRLGFVFGDHLLLVTHRGRRSGSVFQTAVEVVEHDRDTREYFVCSGTGPSADWYRNLHASPALAVQVRNRRWVPSHRFLDAGEAADRFASYEAAHPRVARILLDSMGNSYDGTEAGRIAMMADMPMVAFTDFGPRPEPPNLTQ
jgi:deazaflavin-dependent oxidoreductase (nitroreductase family)